MAMIEKDRKRVFRSCRWSWHNRDGPGGTWRPWGRAPTGF